MLQMATKNDLHQFADFWKISLAVMVEIDDVALRAVIDSFEICIINFKKNETNFVDFRKKIPWKKGPCKKVPEKTVPWKNCLLE